jgi:O-antigen biosynthesis protein
MKKVSIIIPVFNRWNFTKSCLNDLNKLPQDTHEIIVIDNGSSDKTKLLKDHFDFPICIRNEENQGFAKACNIAYSKSQGDIIIFLNNDIRVKNNHNNWTDIICNVINDNNIVGPTGGMVDEKNNFQFLYETNDPNKTINYISGWCLAGKRKTFDKLIEDNYAGPFSEIYGKAYFEDTHLGFMAKKLGIDLKLVDIPVVHFGKISSNQLNTHKLYSEARQIFIKKWSKRS